MSVLSRSSAVACNRNCGNATSRSRALLCSAQQLPLHRPSLVQVFVMADNKDKSVAGASDVASPSAKKARNAETEPASPAVDAVGELTCE